MCTHLSINMGMHIMSMYYRRIQPAGTGSLAVNLPRRWMTDLKLSATDTVRLTYEGRKIVIEPAEIEESDEQEEKASARPAASDQARPALQKRCRQTPPHVPAYETADTERCD
jgi:antitoxin component of MazEF toxin-antitoxin module